jgi:lipopolysaccharide export system permease protein
VKILRRYILREHVGPLFFALGTLTSLLLLNQIAKQFGNLVGKGLDWSVIGEFFLLSVPFIIAMTLPMAVLVATLYAFSRLASENEITALKASGVGYFRIIRPVLLMASVAAVVMIWFNDQVLPLANHKLSTLQTDIARTKPTFALREQSINEVSPGQLYLRAGHIDESTNRLREVTIYDLSDPQRRRTIHADSGFMNLTGSGSDLELTLHSGYSQEVPRANSTEMQRLYFQTDLIRMRDVASSFSRSEDKGYKSDREMSICEMQDKVREAARDRIEASHELESALVNAAHALATGETRPGEPASPAPSEGVSLASLYCRFVLPLFEIPSAQAASVPYAATRVAPQQQLPRRAQARDSSSAAAQAKAADSSVKVNAAQPGNLRNPAAFRMLPKPIRDRLAPAGMPGSQKQVPDSVPRVMTPMAPVAVQPQRLQTSPVNAYANARGTISVSLTQLRQAELEQSGFEVEIQKKFALSAACVVFVLLGATIALRFPRGGVGLVIGVSLAVFSLYYVGLIMGETLANKLILSPFWAMWMANVLFGITGLVLFAVLRRSGGGVRGDEFREMWDRFISHLTGRNKRAAAPLVQGETAA